MKHCWGITKMIRMKCSREVCGRIWIYKGDTNRLYASCPSCHKTVLIKKNEYKEKCVICKNVIKHKQDIVYGDNQKSLPIHYECGVVIVDKYKVNKNERT